MAGNNRIIQSSLVSGILSEDAIGRIDYPKYYNGCAEAKNVFVQPVGGMEKRAGFQFLAPLEKDYRMFEFLFNTNDKYVVLIGDNDIKIWDIMNPTSNEFQPVEVDKTIARFWELSTDLNAQLYTLKQAKELDFVQYGDTMILTHGEVRPQKLVRYRTPEGVVTWKLEVIKLENIPQFNWDTNRHDPGASRVLKAENRTNDILNLRDDIIDAISLGEGSNPRIPEENVDISTVEVDGKITTTTTTTTRDEFWYPSGNTEQTPAQEAKPGYWKETTEDDGYGGTTTTKVWVEPVPYNPGDTEKRWGTKITIVEDDGNKSNTSTAMTWDDPLDKTIKDAIRNRITLKNTDYNDLDAEQLRSLIGDDYTDEINSIINDVLGTWDRPEENISNVWGLDKNGVDHGWPRYCTFYQSRLFFAGSPAKPLTVWGSVLNDFFNFDISESDDDYALADTINSNTLNHITGIYPSNVLQVYTSGSEYTNESTPMTPTNSVWTFQTGMGSKDNVALDSLDGNTIFIDRSGAIRDFIFDYDTNKYISKNIALLARQVIKNPYQLVIIRSSQVDLSKLVYFLNEDGTIAVLNIDKGEGILAWTEWELNGEVVEIVGVDQSLFAIVKRGERYSLECLNRREYTYNTEYKAKNNVYLDAFEERIGSIGLEECIPSIGGLYGNEWKLDGIWGTGCPMFVNLTNIGEVIIDGLEFYNNTKVTVLLDRYYMGEFLVEDGKITVPRMFGMAQIGYPYSAVIKTLPLTSAQYGGQLNYNRIVKIIANFNRSTAVTIDGQFITDRDYDSYKFSTPPQALSGLKEVYTLGWDRFIQFEIRSDYPYRMNLLSFTSYLDSNSPV